MHRKGILVIDSTDQHPHTNIFLLAVSWAGWFFGSVTEAQWVMTATLVYTLLQIYISIRKIIRERKQ